MGNKDERLEGARENLWCFNERAVSYKKFLQLWDEFYPDVVISKTHDGSLFNVSAKHDETAASC